MPEENRGLDPEEVLSGWAAIAAQLGVSEKSARIWEDTLGLPIHRIAGQSRSRVWALRSDLNEWKLRSFKRSNSAEPSLVSATQVSELPSTSIETPSLAPETLPLPLAAKDEKIDTHVRRFKGVFRRRSSLLVAGLLIGGVMVLATIGRRVFPGFVPQASRIKVEADTMKVFDQRGEFMWQYTFPEGLGGYPEDSGLLSDRYAVADLNGDGKNEVLFVHYPRSLSQNKQGSWLVGFVLTLY